MIRFLVRITHSFIAKYNFFLLISVLFFYSAMSQEILTLENAIAIGMENNYGIKIAKNENEISKNNTVSGNAGMLPTITATGDYEKSFLDARVDHFSGLELNNNNAQADNINAAITLKWTLFDGLKMFCAYDRLKKLKELSETELKVVIENTMAEIILKYVDIIKQQLLINVLKEQLNISRFRLELAVVKKNNGSGSDLELLQTQVDLSANESDMFCKLTDLSNAKTCLNVLLSRDVNTDFKVVDSITPGQPLELSSLKAAYSENNKNIIICHLERDAAELELKELQAEKYPEIDFISAYIFSRSNTEASFIKYNRLFGPTLGISANFNIFDGSNLHRKLQNTRISLLTADLQVKQIQIQMESQLLILFNEYQNDLQLIKLEKRSFNLAKKNMEIAKDSYKVGMISSLELREVQKNLLSAGNRLISAQYNAKEKEIALLLISGSLIE
ncbi:TolC family protein [Bacteroidota bacterium]